MKSSSIFKHWQLFLRFRTVNWCLTYGTCITHTLLNTPKSTRPGEARKPKFLTPLYRVRAKLRIKVAEKQQNSCVRERGGEEGGERGGRGERGGEGGREEGEGGGGERRGGREGGRRGERRGGEGGREGGGERRGREERRGGREEGWREGWRGEGREGGRERDKEGGVESGNGNQHKDNLVPIFLTVFQVRAWFQNEDPSSKLKSTPPIGAPKAAATPAAAPLDTKSRLSLKETT